MAKHTLKTLRCLYPLKKAEKQRYTTRFQKYVGPFFNIMHERVKLIVKSYTIFSKYRKKVSVVSFYISSSSTSVYLTISID